jgi:hypothetical protein
MQNSCRTHRWISGFLQVVSAIILAQTLFFKFTGAPESRFIFSTLGIEPWGRIGTGVMELIAVVLLLVPRTAVFGAGLSVGLMSGAIFSHLTKLGLVVQNDGGLLFALATTVLVSSSIVLWLRRGELPIVGALLAPSCELSNANHR